MNFVINQLTANAIATAVSYILISYALFGQFNHLRIVSVSLVASLIGGAYSVKWIYNYSQSTFFLLIVASLVGALLALGGALIHLKIRHKNRALGLLASLGYLKLIQGGIVVLTGGGVLTFPLWISSPLSKDSFLSQPDWLFAGILIVVACAFLMILIFKNTSLGLQSIAIGDDVELSSIFGISRNSVEIWIQVIGGSIAGLAGVLLAIDSGLRPDLGFSLVLKVFAILILTGNRLLTAPIWAFLLALLENVSAFYWGGQLSQALGISVLVIILLGKVARKRILQPKTIRRLESTIFKLGS